MKLHIHIIKVNSSWKKEKGMEFSNICINIKYLTTLQGEIKQIHF